MYCFKCLTSFSQFDALCNLYMYISMWPYGHSSLKYFMFHYKWIIHSTTAGLKLKILNQCSVSTWIPFFPYSIKTEMSQSRSWCQLDDFSCVPVSCLTHGCLAMYIFFTEQHMVRVMACRIFGTKPLLAPMLTYYCQNGSLRANLRAIQFKIQKKYQQKMSSAELLNTDHLVQTAICCNQCK